MLRVENEELKEIVRKLERNLEGALKLIPIKNYASTRRARADLIPKSKT